MSQAEMQKLLYGALASGSDQDRQDDAAQAAKVARDKDEAAPASGTPSELIAHYDFRARCAKQMS